jgi:hypothetical protein|tara:strand:- start:21732 stop:21965 length:234 start_codon:yes stop_codon:yes gene_type:complete
MTRSPELDAWLSTWSDKIHEWELETGHVFLGDSRLEITSRGRFEQWLDKHNHVMALLRTVSSFMAAIFSGMVLYLVF